MTRNVEDFTDSFHISGSGEHGYFIPSLRWRRLQGLFPCKDLIEHSCQPNCLMVTGVVASARPSHSRDLHSSCNDDDDILTEVLPLREIKEGERLSISYLPYWRLLWPTELRRWALWNGWGFVCGCIRCVGAAREVSMSFNCPLCGSDDLCPEGPCKQSQ